MTLQLRMIKAPDGATPPQAQFLFGPQGGSLGRGPDNHWVLPDPERILSSRHCEFLFDNGRFQLIDHSTNGTFINGCSEPLGKGVVTTISHGDQVEVGDYLFVIDLLSADSSSDPSALGGSPFASEPLPDHVADPSAVDDPFVSDPFDAGPLGNPAQESLDPLKALDGASSTSSPEPSSPWSNDPLGQEATPPFSLQRGDAHWQDPSVEAVVWPDVNPEALIPDDWLDDLAPSSLLKSTPSGESASKPEQRESAPAAEAVIKKTVGTRPEKLAPITPSPGSQRSATAVEPSSAFAVQGDAGSELFKAMGVDIQRLDASARRELEPLVGTMVREVVDGLMQVLRSRASIKNEFRMNVTTIQPVENNPLKFSADVDEALDNIFVRRSQAYKEPLQAIREGFQEVAEHQLAMIAGMRSAFEHMLREFDPERLEANFNQQQKPSALSPIRKARYWENYRAHYQGLSDNLERSFQQIFGDEFVQAYQDQLRRLSALRP